MPPLSATCDQFLPLALHEFGVPVLWPENARSCENTAAEKEYFSLAAQLAEKVDRVVYLNRMQELAGRTRHSIDKTYGEVFDAEVFRHRSDVQIRQFLGQMAEFKRHVLGPLLASTLPILRLVFQDNLSLTDAELSVLNNVKKLSSAYNVHPANVLHLVPEYERSISEMSQIAEKEAYLERFAAQEVAPNVRRLRDLSGDLQALENTFQNQFGAHTDERRLKTLLREQKKLEKKARLLSVLSDLLPQLVLCLPTNWHDDDKLNDVIVDCQDLLERLAAIPRAGSMQEALMAEYGFEL